jgi:heat shock protein HslJ
MKIHPTEIWVNSSYAKCENPSQVHYLSSQTNPEIDPTKWECKYQEISGFTYEPSYIYKLKVHATSSDGLTLAMDSLISKEWDANYHRIHDLWALTEMNSKTLEISDTRPNIEINLTTMKILGKGNCNNFSGNITNYSDSSIRFEQISSTKIMCTNHNQETLFFEALGKVVSYSNEKLTLTMYDSQQNPILRFHKVD